MLEEGHDIAIAYMNSNIHPAEEYEHRRAVLLDFVREQGLEVIEGVYDPQAWSRAAGVFGTDPDQRPDRCRACYRLRLEEACAYAAANGFEGVATTLTVSPINIRKPFARSSSVRASPMDSRRCSAIIASNTPRPRDAARPWACIARTTAVACFPR